jgi:NAD(P)-dependent dehydrogenase (short-subunit alcohol dehydrogenase family)
MCAMTPVTAGRARGDPIAVTSTHPTFQDSSMHHVHPRAATCLAAAAIALATIFACHSGSVAHSAAKPMAGSAKQTVLITGANRGIGLELARQYHAAGWDVIATARDPDAAKELRAIGSDVLIPRLDVASQESVDALAKSLGNRPIDLLVNNAGVFASRGTKLSDLDVGDFERSLQVNTIGPIRVTQALLPNLRAGKGRKIVGITSTLGSIANNTDGGFYGYRESKAALNMFMRTLAAELRSEGFICIPMHPGWVQTDMGGPSAHLTPEESVTGMRKVIEQLKPADSGKFFEYDGSNPPW